MYRFLFVADSAEMLHSYGLAAAGRVRARGWSADAMAHGLDPLDPISATFDRLVAPIFAGTPLSLLGDLRRAGRFRDFVLSEQYDVVHLIGPGTALPARVALRRGHEGRSPRIVYTALRNLSHPVERIAARWTDHVIASDVRNCAKAQRFGSLPSWRTHLMIDPTTGWDHLYSRVLSLPPTSRDLAESFRTPPHYRYDRGLPSRSIPRPVKA